MKKELRPYQSELIKKTSIAVRDHKRVILQLGTGGGKSFIAYNIIARSLHKGLTVLVVSESRKIFRQLVIEFSGIKINADTKFLYVEPNRCYVSMAQTLIRRKKILEQFLKIQENILIITDEAHIGTPVKLLNIFDKSTRMIGLTATPDYSVAKHLPALYNTLVQGISVKELIKEKFLCDYKHIARTKADLSKLVVKNGEYTEESQEEVFSSSIVYDGLFEDLKSVTYKKCVIFVSSIKQCDKLQGQMTSHGYLSVVYHSALTDGEQKLSLFTDGDINILITIRSLSKGWDYPPIDLIVLMHATVSTPLFLQEIGRGSRIVKDKKYFFTVLDYGDNWKRHGLYHDDRPWQELWKEKPKKKRDKTDVMAVKMCPSCESIVPAMAKICEYCGAELSVPKELEKGELVDITELFNSLKGRWVKDLNPEELALYVQQTNQKLYGLRVAKSQFLKQTENMTITVKKEDDFLRRYGIAMKYKPFWHHAEKKRFQEQEKIEPIFFKNKFIPLQ